jgi:chromosome segregation ATPase
MCKKLVLAAVAILVGTAVVRHTSIGSLAQVWWRDAKQAVERQVPPEVQIKRLEVEVNKIDRDIKHNIGRLAQLDVSCQQLDEQVAALRETHKNLRGEIADMTKALDGATDRVSLRGKDLRPRDVARKLERAVASFELKGAELRNKEQLLSLKKQALEAANARIGEMQAQRDQLRDTIAKFETRLQLNRLAATRMDANIELDDSQLARCKELANEINQRLLVDQKTIEMSVKYGFTNPVPGTEETKPTADVLKAAKKALEGETVVENSKE